MGQVVVSRADSPRQQQKHLDDVFRFRHHVFHDRLGWEVGSHQGMERDRYDELGPVHMFSRNRRGRIEACWRLLPTSGPYMLEEVFPQLLRGEAPPKDAKIWEISRFAVVPETDTSREQANLCRLTFEMLRAGVEFALKNGIDHYVFVTSVAVERLLRRAGLNLHRFGDGQAQRVGKVLSVACWIDIDDATCKAVNLAPRTAAGREAA